MSDQTLEKKEFADVILIKAKYRIDRFGNKIYDLNSIVKNFTEETQNLLWKNSSKKLKHTK